MPTLAEQPNPRSNQIQRICPPCDQFRPNDLQCRLVQGEASWIHKIFENRPCRAREFLEEFLRRRLSRLYDSAGAAREDAEDLASAVVLDLLERPPVGFFRHFDLPEIRQFLAGRALQRYHDHRRKGEGRMRCGNCGHHGIRNSEHRCLHPDPDHDWSGKKVRASENPRQFAPPCVHYVGGRPRQSSKPIDEELAAGRADAGPHPDENLAQDDQRRLLLDVLVAIQRERPTPYFVLFSFYFQHRKLEEIASVLKCSSRTIKRYKVEAEEFLLKELNRRGISSLDEILATAVA